MLTREEKGVLDVSSGGTLCSASASGFFSRGIE